jgi:hypothetical protein
MLEKEIEKKLKAKVEKLGGHCYKFVSPGTSGMPDRLICLPGNRMYLVETKKPNGKLRALQRYRKVKLYDLGIIVWVITTYEEIDEFIRVVSS